MPQLAEKPTPIVLKDAVSILYDAAWIADHTRIYINPYYDLTEQQVVAITNEIYWCTGFAVDVFRISLDDLLAQKVSASSRDRLNYMAGKPIWRLPAMFVPGVRKGNRKSPVGRALRQAMAIQSVIGKAVVKPLLEAEYGRYPNRFPRGQHYTLSDAHALQFMEHALGRPCFVDLEGDLVAERDIIVSRPTQSDPNAKYLAITCYKFEAARTIARETIDKPKQRGAFGLEYRETRPHIFESNNARVDDEMRDAKSTFGFDLDGTAMGAWYHRVVTALRLGASIFDELDSLRSDVADKMVDENVEIQRLMRLDHSTPADTARIGELRAAITEAAIEFDGRIARVLSQVDSDQQNAVSRCFAPLDAAILAFFGGVNARSTIPGICPELPSFFEDVLESLVWLGHLQRHRVRDFDYSAARTFLNALHHAGGETDQHLLVKNCLEVGMSFLNRTDRALFVQAAEEIASTGDVRTVFLALQDSVAADGQAVNDEIPEDEHHTYFRFNAELGMCQSISPELALRSTFVSLPPFYQTQWDGRWRMQRDEDDYFKGLVPA